MYNVDEVMNMYIKKSTMYILCAAFFVIGIFIAFKSNYSDRLSERDKRWLDGAATTLILVSFILAGLFGLAPDE